MKHAWFVLCLGIVLALSITLQKVERSNAETAQDSTLLRDAQEQIAASQLLQDSARIALPLVLSSGVVYPDFTLEQQQSAVQQLEAIRKATRIDGLRESTPAANWIAMAYHGLLLDANYDIITMDLGTVTKMQESLFAIIYPSTSDAAIKKYGADLEDLFNSPNYQGNDLLVIRSAVLDALLDVATSKLQDEYIWRARLIRGAVNTHIDWGIYILPDDIRNLLRQYLFPDIWIVPPPPSSAYVNSCRAEGVPIPPNWPDSRWVSQGSLAFVFISAERSAEVLTYKDPSVPGICYALPRRNSRGEIELLGIICQGKRTGKACFWDNKTTAGMSITGAAITLNINTIGNGSTLAENCTACHRGSNAYIIHPGSSLDMNRRVEAPATTVPGGPYDTSVDVRYAPIGQASWSNPGPVTLLPPPAGQASCTTCHEIPRTSSDYCRVLQAAARVTMPPFAMPAGWPPDIRNPSYANHITQLSSCP